MFFRKYILGLLKAIKKLVGALVEIFLPFGQNENNKYFFG